VQLNDFGSIGVESMLDTCQGCAVKKILSMENHKWADPELAELLERARLACEDSQHLIDHYHSMRDERRARSMRRLIQRAPNLVLRSKHMIYCQEAQSGYLLGPASKPLNHRMSGGEESIGGRPLMAI
jgi:hypothetical protein